jgi:hypothetical protein
MEKSRLKKPTREILKITAAWVALNCLIFLAYRIQFLRQINQPIFSPNGIKVLESGGRLDLAMMGFELCGVGLIILALRRLRLTRIMRWFIGLTVLHVIFCAANYFSFAERSQNAGDLLLPYITSPYQIYLAVLPFCQQHLWKLMVGSAIVMGAYWWLGRRVLRRLETGWEAVDLWRDPGTFAAMMIFTLLPLLLTFQPLIKRKLNTRNSGLTLAFANSKFYTHFPDFRLNEALHNPLYEFVGTQLPEALKPKVQNRLTESEALEQYQLDFGPPEDANYPLLCTIHGREGSTIENVIIVQVESLSGSVLEQERNGRYVMPFLRKMAQEGFYVSNMFQNANFTSGGVFSTATAIPKAAWEETTRRFAGHEMCGYYATLAQVLGTTNYNHFFFEAFRQSGDDFLAFMANQGCTVLNYQEFRRRLQARHELEDSDSILGIFDGYFMQQCMDELEKCPTRFTAHLMTCTTHSPWSTPASFPEKFHEPAMNTFAYLDASIEGLAKRIEQSAKLSGKTLLVVLGDHTSITFGNNLLERLRIPLIFYAPGLPRIEGDAKIWASQVDVLPTILGLMRGDHRYAGMGRDLLDPNRKFEGVVSGMRDIGFYVTENWVLEYHPFGGESKLYAVTNGVAAPQNSAGENPEILKQLWKKCFARIELARRLGKERLIYPLPLDGKQITAPKAEVRPTGEPPGKV